MSFSLPKNKNERSAVTDFQNSVSSILGPYFKEMVTMCERDKANLAQDRVMVLILGMLFFFVSLGIFYWVRANKRALKKIKSDVLAAISVPYPYNSLLGK